MQGARLTAAVRQLISTSAHQSRRITRHAMAHPMNTNLFQIQRLRWIGVLALTSAGCNGSITPTPEIPTAVAHVTPATIPTAPIETVSEFFARAVAAGDEIAGFQTRAILHSSVVDDKNLWLGVSRRKEDINQ